MAFSQATMVARIRHILNDNAFYEGGLTVAGAGTTTLAVADGTLYDKGAVLEWQDNGEQVLVTNVSSNNLTIVRGYRDTAALSQAHSSQAILKDPVFSFVQVTDAVTATMNGLYPYVYRLVSFTLAPLTNGNKYYELTSASGNNAVIELSQVSQEAGTGNSSVVFFYGDRPGAYPVTLLRDLPTSKVTSGVALWIPFLRDVTNNIAVLGIAEIDDTVSGSNYSYISDGVEVNCIIYGAVSRLVSENDISRATQDDTTMYDASVKPFNRTQLAMYWDNRSLTERHKWEAKLRARTPRLKKWNR